MPMGSALQKVFHHWQQTKDCVQSLSLGCGTTRIVKYDVVGLDMGEVSMLSVVAKSIGTIGY